MARQDMVDGHYGGMLPTILAGAAVATYDFALVELEARARTPDHIDQADHRGTREGKGHGFDLSTTIHDQAGFPIQDQRNRPVGIANVDRLKVCIKD
jgi:hypothetical protein